MIAFLNELSLPFAYSKGEAKLHFEKLGACYKACRLHGVRDLRTPTNLYAHNFAPNYQFVHWLSDELVDQDLRTVLNSAMGTLPHVDAMFDNYQQQGDIAIQAFCEGNPCIGLALASAYINNSLAFSFKEATWHKPTYQVSLTITEENEEGQVVECTVATDVRNVATIEHADLHSKFVTSQIATTINSGRDLWERRVDLFPNLEFIDSTRGQIVGLNNGHAEFRQILNRLFDLQEVARNCTGAPIEPEDFPTLTTRESLTRERMVEKLNVFCPDGTHRLFSWHSRYTPGAGRIHFFPFESEQKILVGYIGQKIL
jgi:hypothetical protein